MTMKKTKSVALAKMIKQIHAKQLRGNKATANTLAYSSSW